MNEKYPEHQKLKAIVDRSQTCGEFIDWLEGREIYLCEHVYDDDTFQGNYYRIRSTLQQLLAEFFEIDLKKIGDEKDAMLEELRSLNGR